MLGLMDSSAMMNTHSHHREDAFFQTIDLDAILKTSYVDWCGVPFGPSPESRSAYLEKVRYKSYFVWLQKGLQAIYHLDEPLTAGNWDKLSQNDSGNLSRQPGFSPRCFKGPMPLSKDHTDAYWDPGSANGHGDIFAPALAINSFLFGYSSSASDHCGKNCIELYGMGTRDMDEYLMLMEKVIAEKKALGGCVALKSSVAYERTLDFNEVSKEEAQKVLDKNPTRSANATKKCFGDYIFFELCKISARLDLPFQCHTGLGLLHKTNALQMQEVIEKNPDTKFVLFHGSYPWSDDLYAWCTIIKMCIPTCAGCPYYPPRRRKECWRS